MPRVLFLVTFRVREAHRDLFLEQARTRLKTYWESHGADRYEVYDEVGPTGPTGRVTQAYWFPSREAYLAMQTLSDPDMPREPYKWLFEPQFQVLDLLVPAPGSAEAGAPPPQAAAPAPAPQRGS
jgi:hypothetical protein